MDELSILPRAQTFSQVIEIVPLQTTQKTQILVIDCHDLGSPDLQQETITTICRATQNQGFFQIINHEITHSLTSQMQEVGKYFFNLSMEEEELYRNEQIGSPIFYGSKLGYTQDAKLDQGDYYQK